MKAPIENYALVTGSGVRQNSCMATMINEDALEQLQERASMTKGGWLNDGDLYNDEGLPR